MNKAVALHPQILLVDDHPLFCDALALTLSEIFEYPQIRTASNLRQAIDSLSKHPSPDIIVLDLNLPDVDGIDGLIQLKTIAPNAKLIVVSSISDNAITSSVLDAGAIGFIPKKSSREALIQAFEAVFDGKTYAPEEYYLASKNSYTEPTKDDTVVRLQTLTPQQGKILSLICEGKLNKQIAYELSIAETTVKAHLTAILRKLNVQNRTQAVLLTKKASFSALAEH